MTFLKCLAAYLTGWLIVQPLYNRLLRAWRRQHLDAPTAEDRAYFHHQAVAIAEELERRERERWQSRPATGMLAGASHGRWGQ